MREDQVLSILKAIGYHDLKYIRRVLFGKNYKRGEEKFVPHRFMRYLIGAGLVQPRPRSEVSWIYRLTPLGTWLIANGVLYSHEFDSVESSL